MADPSSKVLLFSLLFFSSFFFMKKVESQNTSFAINIFTPHSRLLTYRRDAYVPPDKNYVRMTAVNGSGNPRINSVGQVLYNQPVPINGFRAQASFETTITLEMSPDGPYNSNTLGHGITFFMVPINSIRPSGGGAGQYLGIYDVVYPGTPYFAVEFDLANAMDYFYNPPYQHIGINIYSMRSQNFTRSGILVGRRVTARITYDMRTRMISVVTTADGTVEEMRASFVFNLAAILPDRVEVGLSASTGIPRVAFLDVYTWRFNSTMEADIFTDAKPYAM